jgi:hypothetical protein
LAAREVDDLVEQCLPEHLGDCGEGYPFAEVLSAARLRLVPIRLAARARVEPDTLGRC